MCLHAEEEILAWIHITQDFLFLSSHFPIKIYNTHSISLSMSRIDILEDLGIPASPHLEQLGRIKRWKSRLDEIRFNNDSEDKMPHQMDFIYVFFINCYHLKDFLDYSKIISDNEVKSFFDKNIEMQICRDICNESKHCSLHTPSIGIEIPNSKKRSAKGFAGVCIVREYEPFGRETPIKNTNYVVLAKGKKYDVFELAGRCLSLWMDFFNENNLFNK